MLLLLTLAIDDFYPSIYKQPLTKALTMPPNSPTLFYHQRKFK